MKPDEDLSALRTVIGNYAEVRSLKDGRTRSDRIGLSFTEVDPLPDAFRRMVRTGEFDVCEMAVTTLALAHAYGKRLTALPVVLHRGFHHNTLVCAVNSDLQGPADLAGRRVAVRAYSQTTGVWVRGMLEAEYGLDLDSVTWVTTEGAHVEEYVDPPNVVRAAPGKTLRGMVLAGEVDAAIGLRQTDPTEMRTVIPDADAAAAAWFRRTGVYPANHAVVVSSDLLAWHPWLGTELMSLFQRAKAEAEPNTTPARAALKALIGDDTLPYGVAANRAAMEMLLDFATRQKLIPRPYPLEDLFDPALMQS